jgi:hypothetical protein
VVEDLNWLRNNDVKPRTSSPLTALTNLEHQCRGTLTPAQKKKAIDDAMNWLRNNDPNRPTWTIRQQGLANLAGLPCPAVCLRRVVEVELAPQQRDSSPDVSDPLLRL